MLTAGKLTAGKLRAGSLGMTLLHPHDGLPTSLALRRASRRAGNHSVVVPTTAKHKNIIPR